MLCSLNVLARLPWKYGRYIALPFLGLNSYHKGNYCLAEKSARELLVLAKYYNESDWNYGNAIYFGNLILGLVSFEFNKIDEARQYLIHSGNTPGSPQLNSFGPNMLLAKKLLEKGEQKTVLKFFTLCKKFWELDCNKLNYWKKQVRSGKIPDFGSNLNY
ncbi:MAG: hypothetical protein GY749_22990 [Desulfobacteraceae bacterium]|nr:hypothetical protein [Desulfobacteraceae bacterium]